MKILPKLERSPIVFGVNPVSLTTEGGVEHVAFRIDDEVVFSESSKNVGCAFALTARRAKEMLKVLARTNVKVDCGSHLPDFFVECGGPHISRRGWRDGRACETILVQRVELEKYFNQLPTD